MNKSLHLAGAVFVALGISSAEASVVTISIPAPAYTTQNDIGAGQTIGTDGYALFGGSTAQNASFVDPSYVSGGVSAGAGNSAYPGGSGYSEITVSPTPSSHTLVQTGLTYRPYNSPVGGTLATFVLTGTVPKEFQIGLLDDTNASATANVSDYTVYDYNPSTLVTTEMSPTKTSDIYNGVTGANVNDFYLVDISNASPGDTITITGYNDDTTPDHYGLGGITFDTITPAPEPAALSLLAAGTLGLLARQRKTRRQPAV